MAALYSHSRLSSFENCPRQFFFRYVQKVPAESEGVEAFVGKRVHEILERLHQFADGGQLPSIDRVVQRYHALFDDSYDDERIRIVKPGLTKDFYRELGERCLRTYYNRNYPFDRGETIGLEHRVVFDLEKENSSGRYKMQGIIDRITRLPDGTVEIVDYKTGQWVPEPGQARQGSPAGAVPARPGRRDLRAEADAECVLVWHYVAQGQVTRVSRAHEPEQLDERCATRPSRVIDADPARERLRAEEDRGCATGASTSSTCARFSPTRRRRLQRPHRRRPAPRRAGPGAPRLTKSLGLDPARTSPSPTAAGQLNLL